LSASTLPKDKGADELALRCSRHPSRSLHDLRPGSLDMKLQAALEASESCVRLYVTDNGKELSESWVNRDETRIRVGDIVLRVGVNDWYVEVRGETKGAGTLSR
jgi:hypothetical protein